MLIAGARAILWGLTFTGINGLAAWINYRLACRAEIPQEWLDRIGLARETAEAYARTARRQAAVAALGYAVATLATPFLFMVGSGLFFAVSCARCWGVVYRNWRYPEVPTAIENDPDRDPHHPGISRPFWAITGTLLAAVCGMMLYGLLR